MKIVKGKAKIHPTIVLARAARKIGGQGGKKILHLLRQGFGPKDIDLILIRNSYEMVKDLYPVLEEVDRMQGAQD